MVGRIQSCVYGAMIRKWVGFPPCLFIGPESENDGSSIRFALHTLENNREGRKAAASNLIIIRQCNCISKISYPSMGINQNIGNKVHDLRLYRQIERVKDMSSQQDFQIYWVQNRKFNSRYEISKS